MIAIDTNVLLRYLLWDDSKQSEKADTLINGSTLVLLTDIVLVEMVWTLRGKKYNLDKPAIIKVISALFEEKNICFENPQIIWQALIDYRLAKSIKVGNKYKQADFADVLIVNSAKHYAQIHNKTLEGVYTFDKAAQELIGTKVP